MWDFLRTKAGPIGIDLGSSSLKLVQLCAMDGRIQLVAAAASQVPHDIRNNPQFLHEWYITTIRQLLSSRPFKARNALMSLPGRDVITHHLRLPKSDPEQLAQAVAREAQEKLPFFAGPELLRHVVAGEVYDGHEPKLEVIMMAVDQAVMDRHLDLIERAKLETQSISVEPCAVLQAFSPLLQPGNAAGPAIMFIDLGHSGTRIVIAHADELAFCRTLNIMPSAEEPARVARRLCAEISSCARYHDLVFQEQPVTQMVLLGGPAQDVSLCKELSAGVHLPAQAGDPLLSISQDTRFGPHSDFVPGKSNCDWAVATGLSLQGLGAQAGKNAAATAGHLTEDEPVHA